MSGPNASFALPPGDRDDAPFPPTGCSPDEALQPVAGREPIELGADFQPAFEQLGRTLDAAQLARADLKAALATNNLALIKAAAYRLSDVMVIDPRALAHRIRRAIPNRRTFAKTGA